MANKNFFEDALNRLNEIVTELENGDIILEDMTKLYEEGTELIKHCLGQLDDVEKKIHVLSGDQADNLNLESMDE